MERSDFVNTITEGNTYKFVDLQVNKDKVTHEIYLSNSKNGTVITSDQEFEDVLAMAPEQPQDYSP